MKLLLTMFSLMVFAFACNQDRSMQREDVREVEQQREETLDYSDVNETDSFREDADSTTIEETRD